MKTKLLTLALAALTIGLLGSCKKEDPKVSVTGVTLDKPTLDITVGDPDVKLTATIAPENATDKTVSWSSDKTEFATVDNQGNVHAVAPGTATITVTTADGNKTATCAVAVKAALPQGALSGEFSVSATKKVHFSQGNLVATIDATGAPTAWKFSAHQYEYIGVNVANTKIGKEAGDVDLFGWSTDAASNNWGIHTKTSETDGFTTGNFKDWGKAVGDGNTWRTLSKPEWTYLINKDGEENIRKGKYKYGVTVCEKANCLILAPDDFEGTIAESYDAAAWASAEAAGLVCLPAAGSRSEYNVFTVGSSGLYWSSTADGSPAYYVFFMSSLIATDFKSGRYGGYSVRLITECQ